MRELHFVLTESLNFVLLLILIFVFFFFQDIWEILTYICPLSTDLEEPHLMIFRNAPLFILSFFFFFSSSLFLPWLQLPIHSAEGTTGDDQFFPVIIFACLQELIAELIFNFYCQWNVILFRSLVSHLIGSLITAMLVRWKRRESFDTFRFARAMGAACLSLKAANSYVILRSRLGKIWHF